MDKLSAIEAFSEVAGRPDIEILLTARDSRGDYLVADELPENAASASTLKIADGAYRIATARSDGYGPREVVKSIARHRGLRLRLPDASLLAPDSPSASQQFDRLFHRVAGAGNDILRYRAELIPLPSGYWRVETHGWDISPGNSAYTARRNCFPYSRSETTFDVALRESLDALSAVARMRTIPESCKSADGFSLH